MSKATPCFCTTTHSTPTARRWRTSRHGIAAAPSGTSKSSRSSPRRSTRSSTRSASGGRALRPRWGSSATPWPTARTAPERRPGPQWHWYTTPSTSGTSRKFADNSFQREPLQQGGSLRRYFRLPSPFTLLVAACSTISDDGPRLATVDHYVRVKSTAPAFAGQEAKIYVREVALAGTASAPLGVVLFVHGAGTPAEVTFDVPYKDYSWMARLVVLAPAYTRASALEAPNPLAPSSGPMTAQSLADFKANWDRQVGCPEQYEPAASAVVWTEMLASDPVGATWGPGVRRAPQVPTWGFNQAVVAKMGTPFLMVTGVHDKQVAPERVRDLYADLGSKQKVIIDLACSSHNAMWERNRLLLFKASLEWLRDGKVNGTSEGELKLGY